MIFTLLIVFVVSVIAFSLSAVCGGGASFILVPVLGLGMPADQVPAALSTGTAVSSVSRIAVLWKNISWKIVYIFVPSAIPTVWLGALLLKQLNPTLLELVMGIFLLFNLPQLFRKQRPVEEVNNRNDLAIVIIGLLTGFFSGLTGAVGLIFNRFYLTYGLRKEEIVATRAANEVILHVIKLALYISLGLYTQTVLVYGATVAIAAVSSTFFIRYLLPLISEKAFRKTGYLAMVLSGTFMFSSALGKMVNQNGFRVSFKPFSDGLTTSVQWKQSSFAMEYEYDKGFELEHKIKITELPAAARQKAEKLTAGSDKYLIEEVHGFKSHFYEVYVITGGKTNVSDINGAGEIIEEE